MITRIITMPRKAIDSIAEMIRLNANSLALISVLDSANGDFAFNNNQQNILQLRFDDVLPAWVKDEKVSNKLFCMTEKQGIEIIDFLTGIHKSDTPTTLFVSCVAGICRSGAIGLFTAETFGLDIEKFIEENDHILPNEHILNLLHSLAKKRKDVPSANRIDIKKITDIWDSRHKDIF